jgi:ribosomal protein S18 acetylase RimI-like enzyme
LSLLRRLEASVTSGTPTTAEVVDVGPFRAFLSRHTDLIWLNYAMPIGTLEGYGDDRLQAAIADLRKEFADHQRVLRFEFTRELWPELSPALESAGLRFQEAHPLMMCTPQELLPYRKPGVEVEVLDAAAPATTIYTYLAVQGAGFGDGPTNPGDDEVERFRARLSAGLLAGLASVGGQPAGTGQISFGSGLGEMVGVATLPALRRRGVAGTLCSLLVQNAFERGAEFVWLDAADELAQSVYAKLGFQLVGSLLNYIDGSEGELGS